MIKNQCEKDILLKQLNDRNEQLKAIANTYNSKLYSDFSLLRTNSLDTSTKFSNNCNNNLINSNNIITKTEFDRLFQTNKLQ